MAPTFFHEFRISHARRLVRVGIAVMGLLLIASEMGAVSVRPVVKIGVIQSIDLQNKTVCVRASDSKPPLVLCWDKQTRFIQNGDPVEASALLAGTRVEVRYFHPFFGKKFATQFRWNRVTNAPVARRLPPSFASEPSCRLTRTSIQPGGV